MVRPMNRWFRRLLPVAAVLSAGSILVANQVGVMAYTSGSTGYDISYPQCGGRYPTGAFGIIGVNGGYPFVYYNPCLASEYSHTPNPALYINTGYDPSYTQVDGRHSTLECVTQSTAIQGASPQQAAWAVGCSEASRSIAYATTQGVTSPSSWWLDIETSNSWSSTDLSLNQYTIQGIVDTILRQSPAAVGVYSTGYQWHSIVATSRSPAFWATGSPRGRPPPDGLAPTVEPAFRDIRSGSCSTSAEASTPTTRADRPLRT